MAGHLSKADYRITVYNRTAKKALAWVALHRGLAKPTPIEAVEDADAVGEIDHQLALAAGIADGDEPAPVAAEVRCRLRPRVAPHRKHCLLNGLDDIGLTLEKAAAIDSFEAKNAALRPWA